MAWDGSRGVVYWLDCEGSSFGWCDVNELEHYKEETMEKVKDNWAKWYLPDGYEFQDAEGNVIKTGVIKLVKKQLKYQNTYEECAKIMNCPKGAPSGWLFQFDATIKDTYYRQLDILMTKFAKLLICRDAYWKIAGEQMGLGKPWEPDWNDCQVKYGISYYKCTLNLNDYVNSNKILVFPTEEMRGVFYDNFKELIELCKELL